jgi:recombination protein RecT
MQQQSNGRGAPNGALAKQDKQLAGRVETKRTLEALFYSRKAQIEAVIPKHLTADRLLKVALTMILKTPTLSRCSQESLLSSLITFAELGLEPGPMGLVYIVPFGDVATPIIGFKGLIELARRSGQLSSIEARAVHAMDRFDFRYGLEPKLEHVPSKAADPGPIEFVYCIARFKDGSYHVEVMSAAEVDKIRRGSRSGNSPAWKDHYEEMAKKTVVRRAAKYLPLSLEMARALEVDDEDEAQGRSVAPPSPVVFSSPEQTIKAIWNNGSTDETPDTVVAPASAPTDASEPSDDEKAEIHAAEVTSADAPTDPADAFVVRIKGCKSVEEIDALHEEARAFQGPRRGDIGKAMLEQRKLVRQ